MQHPPPSRPVICTHHARPTCLPRFALSPIHSLTLTLSLPLALQSPNAPNTNLNNSNTSPPQTTNNNKSTPPAVSRVQVPPKTSRSGRLWRLGREHTNPNPIYWRLSRLFFLLELAGRFAAARGFRAGVGFVRTALLRSLGLHMSSSKLGRFLGSVASGKGRRTANHDRVSVWMGYVRCLSEVVRGIGRKRRRKRREGRVDLENDTGGMLAEMVDGEALILYMYVYENNQKVALFDAPPIAAPTRVPSGACGANFFFWVMVSHMCAAHSFIHLFP